MERPRALRHRLVEQVLLRGDVRVERALLDAERLGDLADRGAVVALLREQPRGLPGQLLAPGAHRLRSTSAAARRTPPGSPAASKVAAISSISPTQRQPFAPAERNAR